MPSQELEKDKQAMEKRVPPSRNKSKDTLLIETALDGSGYVSLVEDPEAEEEIDAPKDIAHVEAMEAASIAIKNIICDKGSITAEESADIIQQKMKILTLLWSHFPGAMSSKEVLEGFKTVVEKRGYTPDNTLFAQR